MEQQKYLGHMSQLYGVEEVRLIGGKGDGMRLFQVRNASGLSFTVSADRAADISRLYFKGSNMGYFSPCGYVSPEYYDDKEDGFLKSFTAGFMTTCGLASVGVPCVDLGEQLPLHGTISNTPCETIFYEEDDNTISIKAKINDSRIFARKYLLDRRIICGKFENKVSIIDTVSNMGDKESPLMLLYHINFGYPLLSENAVIKINSTKVIPRNEHAAKDLDKWNIMEENGTTRRNPDAFFLRNRLFGSHDSIGASERLYRVCGRGFLLLGQKAAIRAGPRKLKNRRLVI